MLRPDDGAWYDKDDPDDQPSGSGVVPDKPALAYDESCDDASCDCCETWRALLADIRREGNAPVPAVTDDEAATKVIELTLQQHAVSPNDIICDLRSAGFLIVHHTKET
jgi:hypothetical protein